MAVLGNNTETFLTGLSDFWQRFFSDKEVLQGVYAGAEVALGQAYLDMVTEVLNVNLTDMPLFNREFWKLMTMREDLLRFQDGGWTYPLPDNIAHFHFLTNRIYNPTVALERDIDFTLDEDERTIAFAANPFDTGLDGVPSRQVDIVPTIFQTGLDGIYDPLFPRTFSVRGFVRDGIDGGLPIPVSSDQFTSVSANFTADDIGRVLVFTYDGTTYDGVGPNPAPPEILAVLDPETLLLDTAITITAAPVTDLPWEIRVTEVFASTDVGDDLVLQDPVVPGTSYTAEITAVDPGGLSVTIDQDIGITPDSEAVPWTHQSKSRVTEFVFWIPDAFIDRENLWLSFGYLVSRYEVTSESYRSLLEGIFRYFILGPTIGLTEAALNVMSGVPVVREDGEVVTLIDTADADFDIVYTDRRSYEIPKGSLKPEIVVGTELEAFEALTTIFTVADHIADPNWYLGEVIPENLVENANVTRRNVDPTLYRSLVGNPRWLIGDPGFFIGADDSRFVPQDKEGLDGRTTGTAVAAQNALFQSVHPPGDGEQFTIDGKLYTLQNVLVDANGNIQIGSSFEETAQNIFDAVNLTGTAGVQYATSMTIHPTVTATATFFTTTGGFFPVTTSSQVNFEAKTPGAAGNSIAVSETLANGNWTNTPNFVGGSGLGGGAYMTSHQQKFFEYEVDQFITIAGNSYQITEVGTSPEPYVKFDGDITADLLASNFVAVVAEPSVGNGRILITGAGLTDDDVGRFVRVNAGTLGGQDFLISEVLSAEVVTLVDIDTLVEPVLILGDITSVFLGLVWEIESRAPLRHTTGYLFMRDFLKQHIFTVSYDLTEFPDIPFPRLDDDVRDVLLEGKPAYVTMFFNPNNYLRDTVCVAEEVLEVDVVVGLFDDMEEIGGNNIIGDHWMVGDYYYYAYPTLAWIDLFRGNELALNAGKIGEILIFRQLPRVGEQDKVAFSLYAEGGTGVEADIEVWYTDQDDNLYPTGDIISLELDGANIGIVDTNGLDLWILARLSFTVEPPIWAVNYGYIRNEPATIQLTEDTGYTELAANFPGGSNEFVDPSGYQFNQEDIGRQITVLVQGIPERFWISAVNSDTSVNLLSTTELAVPNFAAESDVAWRPGPPRRLATPVVVGGQYPTVPHPDEVSNEAYILSWPILVTLDIP